MKTYRVYGIIDASKFIGEYEAETEEEAIEKCMNDDDADHYTSLCHQCSREIEIGDIVKYQVEADED